MAARQTQAPQQPEAPQASATEPGAGGAPSAESAAQGEAATGSAALNAAGKLGGSKGEGGRVRVVCSLPNASHCISGILFATVDLDGTPIHVSERVPRPAAERLTQIEGYAIWAGDEAAHARAIEDALDAIKPSVPAAGGAASERRAEAELRRQLEEQQASNRALADDLRILREQHQAVIEENARLKTENDALKAAGVRA